MLSTRLQANEVVPGEIGNSDAQGKRQQPPVDPDLHFACQIVCKGPVSSSLQLAAKPNHDCVYDAIGEIDHVAQGKTKAYL